MAPRTLARMRRIAAMIVMFGGMIALVGCDPRPFFYFLQPFEPTIPPPGPELKGKKVVVLTHCTAGTQAEFPGLERDLNVLQGSAKVHIQAFELAPPKNSKGKPIHDQPKESKAIYDDYQESTFPIRGPIPMDSGVGRAAFKTRFLQVVAAESSWHFVEHSQGDVIQDVKFNQR